MTRRPCSIRWQIVLIACGAVAIFAGAAIFHAVSTEVRALERSAEADGIRLVQTLAANSATQVLANDPTALNDSIGLVRGARAVRYAMVFAPDGRVLAHTDPRQTGTITGDYSSLGLADGPRAARIIVHASPVADAVAPVQAQGVVIGWARVGLDRNAVLEGRTRAILLGVFVLCAAVLAAGLLAAALANRLIRRLSSLNAIAESFGLDGVKPPAGTDELQSATRIFETVAAAFVKMEVDLRESGEQLQDVSQKFKDVLACLPDAVILCDHSPGRRSRIQIADLNPAAEAQFGTSAAIAPGRLIETVLPPERRAVLMPLLAACFETGNPAACEEHLPDESGGLDVETAFIPVKDENGAVRRVVIVSRDIGERKRLAKSLHVFRAALENCPVPVFMTSADGVIEYVNPAFCANTQYTAAEAVGQTPRIVRGEGSSGDYVRLWRTILSGAVWRGSFNNKRKDGSLHWVDATIAPISGGDGRITQFVAYHQDISGRMAAEKRAEFLSHYDPLTGLPNRLLGKDRLEQAMALSDRTRCKAAAILLDVDSFKQINGSLGEYSGDSVLKGVAERLADGLRKTDTIARLSGDEFLIVLSNVRDNAAVTAVAASILDRMARPFNVGGQEVRISVSAGIAVYPDDGKESDTLLGKAGMALKASKEAGKNTYRFFARDMNAHAGEYLSLRAKLQNALTQQEFAIYYQPQIDLKSGRVKGVEAFLRWNSPDLGSVSPDRFGPVAEDSGLIVPIGNWMLREACRQVAAWQKLGHAGLSVAVNLSLVQLRGGDITGAVKRAVEEAKLDPSCLELEVAESILMKDAGPVLSAVRCLKALGVTLSIDEFGTGYSSLSYLKRYGASKVKIDPSFIRDLTDDVNSEAVVDAIVHMARSLGMTTIAEGVEDGEVLDVLRHRDCDGVQGIFYAQPLPAAELRAFLTAPRS